ncbi:MAG: hypothetical protein WC942_04590 [Clostridia bacterium]|jgi:hypothetical protein
MKAPITEMIAKLGAKKKSNNKPVPPKIRHAVNSMMLNGHLPTPISVRALKTKLSLSLSISLSISSPPISIPHIDVNINIIPIIIESINKTLYYANIS